MVPARTKQAAVPASVFPKNRNLIIIKRRKMNFIREHRIGMIVFILGIIFMILGAARGETEVVFRKAVNICMECIGLG